MICKKHNVYYLKYIKNRAVYIYCPVCERLKSERLKKLKEGPIEDAKFSYLKEAP